MTEYSQDTEKRVAKEVCSVRHLVGNLFLRYSLRLSPLRRAPFIGAALHWLSHHLLMPQTLIWAPVSAGPGKGLWLELNPRTGQSYREGRVECEVQQALVERLRPGMVMYDLGANMGFFTLLAARLVGPLGKVFSFEPDPDVADRFRRNIERNGFSNVTVVEAGAWSSTATACFTRARPEMDPDRGRGKISPSAVHEGDSITVRCVALDDFIKTAPLPDFIKCDVEGVEVEVFLGAQMLLRLHRPAIVCEVHSVSSLQLLQPILEEQGYELTLIDNHLLAMVP